MQKAISTYLFRQHVLGVHLLDEIARSGFDMVEVYCARSHFDYANANHARELAEWFNDSEVKLHSLHAPQHRDMEGESPHAMISIAFTEKQRRQDSMDEIKRALELAERVPFRYLILHLGMVGEEFDLRKFDAAMTSLEHLQLFAKQRGVQILLENIPSELSSPRRLIEFIEHTHMQDLRLCLDVGHAHLDGGLEEALELMSGRILSTHLHDNNGTKDDHFFPGSGAMRWDKVLSGVRKAAPGAPLLLEVRSVDTPRASLEKAVNVFARFEQMLEKLAKDSEQE